MSHLVAFGVHVPPALRDRWRHDRNLIDHREVIPVVHKCVCLLGIVGQETHLGKSKILEDLQADAVVTRVGAEPERGVGLDRVEPLILQAIGADLLDQADASPFLRQIDQRPCPFGADHLQGHMQLVATIAPQ